MLHVTAKLNLHEPTYISSEQGQPVGIILVLRSQKKMKAFRSQRKITYLRTIERLQKYQSLIDILLL